MKEGWEYKKLGKICQILNGFAFKSSMYVLDGIRVIRISNVQKGIVEDKDPKFYPLSMKNEIENYLLNEGDLLISLTGNVGRVGLLVKELLPAALNQRVACLRIKDNSIDKQYLFHFLNSDYFENICIKNSKGAAQLNMSTVWLSNYAIPVPSLSEQQSIVAELDKINEIIDLKKAQLKDLDLLAQSIFYDMFGDPIENPKGWEVKKLGEVCSAQNGLVNPMEAPYNRMYHIGPANIVSNTGEIVDLKIAAEENLKSGKYLFEPGMVLYSKIRPNLNKVSLATFLGICSADMYPLICGEELEPLFLLHTLRHQHFLKYAIENSGRANIPKINREALFAYDMMLPPLSLQQSFAEKIQAIESQKAAIKQSLTEVETLLASRMDFYFN